MADVINLRLARKAKARADGARLAETNRAKFGQTRSERQRLRSEAERAERQLDGARRDPPGGSSE